MNCKNCGKEITYKHNSMLGDFCSENCFWNYQDLFNINVDKKKSEAPHLSDGDIVRFDMIKKSIKRNKFCLISNKTLNPYLSSAAFDKFIKDNNLMIVKLPDTDFNLSVIKKSII